ncbi:S-adenosyl-L-methionine-dependent methyltransferase [Wilcoxina mikolae CBS 423.85]|nr:S-adenosyl-L-methionine-dependent methyltransferase [Wilcoxina mikolae CBS 423.85]
MSTSQTHIEVDPSFDRSSGDEFTDGSSDYMSSTQSVTSSINEHIFENGRRYHIYYGPDKNMLPTDEAEQDRLDLHHEIFLRLMGGRLFDAPIRNEPQRVLDIGTGTGIWCIDMADQYPMAEVIGTDITPIQPQWVPPNCRFELDDMETEWTYKPDTFDFIHARNIAPSVSNWKGLMGELFRCTTPGGYVELCEVGGKLHSDDGSLVDENPLNISVELTKGAMEMIGRSFPVVGTLKKRLEDAGFIDVKETFYKQPFGQWPKDPTMKHTGAMALMMLETGIEAYALAALTRILQMDPEDAAQKIKDALHSAKDRRVHCYNH